MKALVGFILITFVFSSCLYENEEEIKGVTVCDTSVVKYSIDIVRIMDESCNGCHSTDQRQGGVVLDNYNSTVKYVKNGGLLGSVLHKAGYSAMPKGSSKLDACSLALIDAWIKAGYPNN